MDSDLLRLAAVLGLSTAVGLNTTLPMLLIGLASRGGWLALEPPFDVLASSPVIAVLTLLAVGELVADRHPDLQSALHTVQTYIALAAGAVVAGTEAGAIGDTDPKLVALVGFFTAGTTHLARTSIRPALGKARLARHASTAEDAAAVALTGSAIVAPWLTPVLLIGLFAVGVAFLLIATKGVTALLRYVLRDIVPWVIGRLRGREDRISPLAPLEPKSPNPPAGAAFFDGQPGVAAPPTSGSWSSWDHDAATGDGRQAAGPAPATASAWGTSPFPERPSAPPDPPRSTAWQLWET